MRSDKRIHAIEDRLVQCPYCGEQIELYLDLSGGEQDYIEDCTVCCQPIHLQMIITDDGLQLSVKHENEV